MIITLDGHAFELQPETGVSRTPLIEWPDNVRLDGQQKRKDRSGISSWTIDRWAQGLGVERKNAALSSHDYRLWDAENVDTRWEGQIVRSPQFNVCTIVPSFGGINIHIQHLGDLYFIDTERVQFTPNLQAAIPAVAWKFTPPNTLGSFSRLGYTAGNEGTMAVGSVFGARAFGKKIIFQYFTQNSDSGGNSEGTTNRVAMVPNLGAHMVPTLAGQQADIGIQPITRLVQFGDFGGTPHLLEYRGGQNTVGFFVGDQDLVLQAAPVASIGAVIGSYLPPLVTDGLTMYAQLPQGIYDFDATPAIVVSTERAEDQNGGQVMFRNKLYFKNKYSLNKYDGADLESVGYDLEDGLASDKWGEITAMTSSWKWNFAAVKGATYSHILTVDKNNYWQYYARVPSPGIWVKEMFLSDAPDAIDRLWLLFDNSAYPGYFLNPMVNPLQAATYSFVPTGHFTPPIYDGGMAEEKGAFFDLAVTADKCDSNRNITALYGLEGADPTSTLGLISTTSQAHIFGSPYGLEGYRIQPQFILTGSSGDAGPVYREATIHYLKDPAKREYFDVIIDLELSAKPGKPTEALIGTLNKIRDTRTLVPFWYGHIGTKAVKVLSAPSEEETEHGKIYQGERTGLVSLRLMEMM